MKISGFSVRDPPQLMDPLHFMTKVISDIIPVDGNFA